MVSRLVEQVYSENPLYDREQTNHRVNLPLVIVLVQS